MSKYDIGDFVVHDGGGYSAISRYGLITGIKTNAEGKVGYDVLVTYPDGNEDVLFFFEEEIINKIN